MFILMLLKQKQEIRPNLMSFSRILLSVFFSHCSLSAFYTNNKDTLIKHSISDKYSLAEINSTLFSQFHKCVSG